MIIYAEVRRYGRQYFRLNLQIKIITAGENMSISLNILGNSWHIDSPADLYFN